MICIKELLDKLVESAQPRLVSNGFACWLAYAQPLPNNFFQFLTDLGGWSVVEDKNQSLWFFPATNTLPSLIKMPHWARLEPIPTAMTFFEASLAIDEQLSQSLQLPPELTSLRLDYPQKLVTHVSAKLHNMVRSTTNLAFKQIQSPKGVPGEWFDLEAHEPDPDTPTLNWIWLIRPQKGRHDKAFAKGWKIYFDCLKTIFHQLKIAYLQTEEHALILKINCIRGMNHFIYKLFELFMNSDNSVWPCQYMGLEMGSHSFSTDFFVKMRHLLDPLEFNALYLPLKIIFQIADPQIVPVDSRVSLNSSQITDLYQLQFHPQADGKHRGSLDIFLPTPLLSGAELPCFYCGLPSHLPSHCPSKILEPGNIKITALSRLARINFDDLKKNLKEIEKQISPNLLQGLSNLLMEKNDPGIVVNSIFEVNKICQLRMVAMVWRAKGKEWPHGIQELRPPSEDYLWEALDALRLGDPEQVLAKLDLFTLKAPQSYQIRVLHGFLALERGELHRAASLWKEAEHLSYTGLQRSYLQLLQARSREIDNDLPEAIRLYDQAHKNSPGFSQARYRQAVCMVKSGYLHQAQAIIRALIDHNPDYFSIVLLDPELESARSFFLADLWAIWDQVQIKTQATIGTMEHLPDLLTKWLRPDHENYTLFRKRIDDLATYADINNYVSTAKLLQGAMNIHNEIQVQVKKDIQGLSTRCKKIQERLKEIDREISRFPFSFMRKGFMKVFSACTKSLNALAQMDLYTPAGFHQGHETMRHTEPLLAKLEKKLLVLRAVYNSTLYSLLFVKYVVFYEILALILAGGLALTLNFVDFESTILGRNFVQDKIVIFKMLIIVLSFIAVAISIIQSTAKFEQYKDRFLKGK